MYEPTALEAGPLPKSPPPEGREGYHYREKYRYRLTETPVARDGESEPKTDEKIRYSIVGEPTTANLNEAYEADLLPLNEMTAS